jgi:excisionase family DNA binding protein
MRPPKAGIPGVASTPQAPAGLGSRPIQAILEELSAVLRTLPPEALGGAVAAVLGVVVREVVRPFQDVLAGVQALQDARSDGLVSTRAAAQRLGVHPWTIRAAIQSGELPHVRIGRCLRIKVADLDRFVSERREGEWRA